MNEVFPDGPVELAAHLPKPAGGAHQSRLRSSKGRPRLQRPAEVIGIEAQQQPVVLQLGALRRRQEVAAVYQHSPVTDTIVLIGIMVA